MTPRAGRAQAWASALPRHHIPGALCGGTRSSPSRLGATDTIAGQCSQGATRQEPRLLGTTALLAERAWSVSRATEELVFSTSRASWPPPHRGQPLKMEGAPGARAGSMRGSTPARARFVGGEGLGAHPPLPTPRPSRARSRLGAGPFLVGDSRTPPEGDGDYRVTTDGG